MVKKPIYGIKEFPKGSHLWRVVSLCGVSRSSKIPSEPVIEVLLSRVPDNVMDPLSREALTSERMLKAEIGVGQLPYVSTGSCWRNRRPVPCDASNYIRRLRLDTAKVRIVSIGDLYEKHGVMPPSAYKFGTYWNIAAKTLVAAIEVRGDPWAVIIPTIELIRFYYASSSRLAQALFWGCYHKTFNPEKSGDIGNGLHRIHLKMVIDDSDSWTLARFRSSTHMQQQVSAIYSDYQKFSADWYGRTPPPFRSFRCGFPFEGTTEISAVCVPLPSPKTSDRVLVLRLLRCSAPFPFDELVCDRDNNNQQGENADDEDLPFGWIQKIRQENSERPPSEDDDSLFHSDMEPQKYLSPIKIDIREDRFSYLDGKKLITAVKERQKVRSRPLIGGKNPLVSGLSTGEGMWGETPRRPAKVNTAKSEDLDRPKPVMLPATLSTFFKAIEQLRVTPDFTIQYVDDLGGEPRFSVTPACVTFPIRGTKKKWSKVSDDNGTHLRRVAIVEIEYQDRLCYVIEGERNKTALATLIIAGHDFARISSARWNGFLQDSAGRRRWMAKSETPEFRREKTTHGGLVTVDAFAEKIRNGIMLVFGAQAGPTKRTGKKKRAVSEKHVAAESASVVSE